MKVYSTGPTAAGLAVPTASPATRSSPRSLRFSRRSGGRRVCGHVAQAIGIAAVILFSSSSGLAAAADSNLRNDAPANATHLNEPGNPFGLGALDAESNAGFGMYMNEPDNCRSYFYHSTAWYVFYPHMNGEASFFAHQGAFYPVVSVFPVDQAGNYGDKVCETSPGGNATVASVRLYVSPPNRYLVQVGAATNTSQGTYRVVWGFDPDSDGDRLIDKNDECASQSGPAQHKGCPDSDGDGLRDKDDVCPTQRGPRDLGGCPDSDTDGIVDKSDACAGEDARARDANKNGCLDLAVLEPKVKLTYRDASGGIRVKLFTVRNLVKGAKVQLECKRPRCRRVSARTGKTSYTLRRFGGLRLPAGMQLFVRVTAGGYVGKYYSIRIKAGGYKTSERCLAPGSKKPKRRCSPVR